MAEDLIVGGTTYDDVDYLTVRTTNGKKVNYYQGLTEQDKAEIAQMVIVNFGGNPVVGYVDENNNIIVQGNLNGGSYSVKYEMEDGSIINIGNLVLDTNVYYSVTNNNTNCTNSNGLTSVIKGSSYSATISAHSGYELKSLVVTMGGQTVSVSGGNINIAKVTGDIVITAVAEKKVIEPEVVVNLIPTALDPDLTSVYNGVGYKANARISNSSGGEKETTAAKGDILTGLIPVGSNGDVFHIRGVSRIKYLDGYDSGYYSCWDSSGNYISNSLKAWAPALEGTDANGDFTITFDYSQVVIPSSTAYIRFQFGSVTGNFIMTRNQLIP